MKIELIKNILGNSMESFVDKIAVVMVAELEWVENWLDTWPKMAVM